MKTESSPTSSSSTTNFLRRGRHRRFELEADHVAAAAALQRRLVRAHQIFGFFLDLDVTVAQHAEGALALDVEAGEQLGDEQADDGLEPDEAQLLVLGIVAAEADEALELAREWG